MNVVVLAVLGRNIDLLVDHGRFFACLDFGFLMGVEYDCKETGA